MFLRQPGHCYSWSLRACNCNGQTWGDYPKVTTDESEKQRWVFKAQGGELAELWVVEMGWEWQHGIKGPVLISSKGEWEEMRHAGHQGWRVFKVWPILHIGHLHSDWGDFSPYGLKTNALWEPQDICDSSCVNGVLFWPELQCSQVNLRKEHGILKNTEKKKIIVT